MTIRIAINGFGRIGRLVVRALFEEKRNEDIELVAINSTASIESTSYLLRYDSIHGRFNFPVEETDDGLTIDGSNVKVFCERDPQNLPWKDLDIDIVLECSGAFNHRQGAQKHIDAGAGKVLISAPAKDVDKTIVYGVNSSQLHAEHKIVSNASCTTNCLAPLAAVLHKTVGIEKGFMTTIHSYTGDQRMLDGTHKDLHRARAAALSIVPTSTGAAKAVGLVLPELKGKLDGVAVRVPTPNVSLVDLTFTSSKNTSVQEINDALIAAENGSMKGVLGTYDEPLVSVDFNHSKLSSIASLDGTKVVDGDLVRAMAWYDNEWGFSLRMLDVAKKMASS